MKAFLSSKAAAPATIGLALLAIVVIEGCYAWANFRLQRAQQRESADRSSGAEERRRQVEAGHRAELEQLCGGMTGLAARNPELSIAAWLRLAGLGCVPTGANVAVRLDRFTEYDVDVVLRRPVDDLEMARITKCFLSECSAYVNSIRFVVGTEVMAEADKRKIDSVPDWHSVSLDSLR